jgi:hypothetical protein
MSKLSPEIHKFWRGSVAPLSQLVNASDAVFNQHFDEHCFRLEQFLADKPAVGLAVAFLHDKAKKIRKDHFPEIAGMELGERIHIFCTIIQEELDRKKCTVTPAPLFLPYCSSSEYSQSNAQPPAPTSPTGSSPTTPIGSSNSSLRGTETTCSLNENTKCSIRPNSNLSEALHEPSKVKEINPDDLIPMMPTQARISEYEFTHERKYILSKLWQCRRLVEQADPFGGLIGSSNSSSIHSKNAIQILEEQDLSSDLIVDMRVMIEDMVDAPIGDPGYRLEYPSSVSPEKRELVHLAFALGRLHLPKRIVPSTPALPAISSGGSDLVSDNTVALRTSLQVEMIQREVAQIPADNEVLNIPVIYQGQIYSPRQVRSTVLALLDSLKKAISPT